MSVLKFCFIQAILSQVNIVVGFCPYLNNRHNSYDAVAHIVGDQIISDNNMWSPITRDNYETYCAELAPKSLYTVINRALHKAVNSTDRYINLNKQVLAEKKVFEILKFITDMDHGNYYLESATKYIQKATCASKYTTTVCLPTVKLERFTNVITKNLNKEICNSKYPRCSIKSRYRSIDGTCSNLERPLDGRAGDCMHRLLPPDYKDGISQFRASVDGSPLPNARLLSTELFGQDDKREFSTRYNQFHAFFGEFVVGDNGMTLSHKTAMRANIVCCGSDGHPQHTHPQCAAISIKPNNYLLGQFYPNQTCMEATRSVPCVRCKLGPRMIASSVTAAQDLSSVYGVSVHMANARRTMFAGGLVSDIINGEEIFAVERFNATGRYRCFKGMCELSQMDIRNLALPTGQVWGLLFHRNHNRHARHLAATQTHWNDERIYQEARKWNIAEYQHIVYHEYIKTLIGSKLTDYFGILPKRIGKFTNYKPSVRLKTIVEFQSTAGRHGHSALTEDLFIINPKTGHESSINFRNSELHESIFYDGHIDGMFLAQMSKPAFKKSPSVPFKTFLFDVPGRPFGLDLASLDIVRQRDNGIPGYIKYLKYCHDVDVDRWEDLEQFIDFENIEKLKQFYNYVEDVELFVGGHYERQDIVEAEVGPTFACIMALQFHSAKYGDRYFYEHGSQFSSFTMNQLNEIKTKSSIASILCKNTRLKRVLSNPLANMSKANKFVPCSGFDDINYHL